MELDSLGNLGSFIGGIATAFGLFSLIVVWLQWQRTKTIDRIESDRLRADAHREIRLRLRTELNEATRLLLVDRPNLYRDAFAAPRADFMSRGVAAISAVRLTRMAVQRLIAASDELSAIEAHASTDAAMALAASYAELAAKDDARFVDHLNHVDQTMMKVIPELRDRLPEDETPQIDDPLIFFRDGSRDRNASTRQLFSAYIPAANEISQLEKELQTMREAMSRK